jgi:hypothetical protein
MATCVGAAVSEDSTAVASLVLAVADVELGLVFDSDSSVASMATLSVALGAAAGATGAFGADAAAGILFSQKT